VKSPKVFLAAALVGLSVTGLTGAPVVTDPGPGYFEPTREIVTPHIAWANPHARGPIRTLFIVQRFRMREVVEIAQRLELDYTVYAVNREKGGGRFFYNEEANTSTWGNVIKGSSRDEETARLRRALKTRYDLFVLGSLDWRELPDFAKYEILAQVKNSSGLVRANLNRLGYGALTDEYLTAATRDRIAPPHTVAAGVPWKNLPVFAAYRDTDEFLSATLSVSRFGAGRIVEVKGFVAPDLQFITPGFTADTITEHADSGDAWADESKNPGYRLSIPEIRRLDYDYYLAYVVRIMLYACNRLADVQFEDDARPETTNLKDFAAVPFPLARERTGDGPAVFTAAFILRDADNRIHASETREGVVIENRRTLSFAVPAVPAGSYFADLWLKHGNRIVEFGTVAVTVAGEAGIERLNLDKTSYRLEEPVTGEVGVTPGTPGRARLKIRRMDNFGREVSRDVLLLRGNRIRFALAPCLDPLTVYHCVEAELFVDERLLDRKKAYFTCANLRRAESIRYVAWQFPYASYLSFYLFDELYKAGFDTFMQGTAGTALQRNYYGLESSFKQGGRFEIGLLSNLGYMPGLTAFKDGSRLEPYKNQYVEGVRLPCLTDPEYRRKLAARAGAMVKELAPFSVTEYLVTDDSGFTYSGRKQLELCFSPTCVRFFQQYLRQQYGDISALNTEYGSRYFEFEEIRPITLDQALRNPALIPLWLDFRLAMERNYTNAYVLCRDAFRAADPAARFGSMGSSASLNSYNAIDFRQITEFQDIAIDYDRVFGGRMQADFSRPDALISMGYYGCYGPNYSREFNRLISWDQLFRGGNLFATWLNLYFYAGMMAFDFSFYDFARANIEEMREIKSGIGQLIHQAAPVNEAVAILYSPASVHRATVSEKTLRTRLMEQLLNAYTALLTDCGCQFHFLYGAQLAAGALKDGRTKLLILPYAQALSPAEIQAIKDFARAGGKVWADLRPGICDGHGKPYEKSPLDELFGVTQDTGGNETTQALTLRINGDTSRETAVSARVDISLKVAGGRARRAVQGTPLVISHTYGRGRATLFNLLPAGYVNVRDIISGMRIGFLRDNSTAPAWQEFFRAQLAEAGIRPRVTCEPELPDLYRYSYRTGHLEYLALLQELPESVWTYSAGAAGPLTDNRTTVRLPGPAHVYDARQGRYLGKTECIKTIVTPGLAQVYALLPYRVRKVQVVVPAALKQGESLTGRATIVADGERPGKHVIHLSCFGPDGSELRYYARNLDCAKGWAVFAFRLALNETPGKYRLAVRDAATGLTGRAEFTVRKVE